MRDEFRYSSSKIFRTCPKRKEYLAEHRRIFEEKEIERKGPNYIFEDELDFDDDDL